MATLPDCPVRWLTYGNPKTIRKLGEQGKVGVVLGWVMKEELIPSRDMSVRSVKRICFWLNERVRLMVLNGVVEYS
ncbi:hypothetical protein TNCV_2099891 [Trichonephila clavipes]|nr:hypothetical protein TNCV_2099891 [Trichonephila clavipes]